MRLAGRQPCARRLPDLDKSTLPVCIEHQPQRAAVRVTLCRHSLEFPVADLDSKTDKTYSVQGSATHDHPFTLTAANLARLKAGQTILVTTTGVALEHSHDVSGGSCA